MSFGSFTLFKGDCAQLTLTLFDATTKQPLQSINDTDLSSAIYIFTLTMTGAENWFTLPLNSDLNRSIDALEDYIKNGRHPKDSPLPPYTPDNRAALILTASGDKFFSQGLDLQAYSSTPEPQQLLASTFYKHLRRMLTLGVVTVAAINGHCMAGGMGLALTCDFRLMRADRGFMQMLEINIPSSIPLGLQAVVEERIKGRPDLQRDILILGKRISAKQAKEYGIVDDLVPSLKELPPMALDVAMREALSFGKWPFLSMIKRKLYRQVVATLSDPEDVDHFKFAAISKM